MTTPESRIPLDRKYVVILATDLSKVDFSQVQDDSINSVRYSLDESKVVLKYEGGMPSSISSLQTKTEYTYNEILVLMESVEWNTIVDEIDE
jgi:hypothetical protein